MEIGAFTRALSWQINALDEGLPIDAVLYSDDTTHPFSDDPYRIRVRLTDGSVFLLFVEQVWQDGRQPMPGQPTSEELSRAIVDTILRAAP